MGMRLAGSFGRVARLPREAAMGSEVAPAPVPRRIPLVSIVLCLGDARLN